MTVISQLFCIIRLNWKSQNFNGKAELLNYRKIFLLIDRTTRVPDIHSDMSLLLQV